MESDSDVLSPKTPKLSIREFEAREVGKDSQETSLGWENIPDKINGSTERSSQEEARVYCGICN